MFESANYKRTYDRIVGALSKPVTLKVNNGTGFDEYRISAHVANWQERDLIAGGSIETGDLRVIINADQLPIGLRRLDQRDRIRISERDYAVISWDTETRSIGDSQIAVEATVRG